MYVCSLNKPSVCIVSPPHSRCDVSYWVFSILRGSNDSGLGHILFYMWTFRLIPLPTDPSESEQVSC